MRCNYSEQSILALSPITALSIRPAYVACYQISLISERNLSGLIITELEGNELCA